MDIASALKDAYTQAGLSIAHVAVAGGVSESTARRWIAGDTTPPGDALMRLRREIPGFAGLLDRAVA